MRDSASKVAFGHVVFKRVASDAIVEDVKWLGYTETMLKTDNEPASLKLLTESLRELRIQGLEKLMSESSPE